MRRAAAAFVATLAALALAFAAVAFAATSAHAVTVPTTLNLEN
jgi:hypothetical protein